MSSSEALAERPEPQRPLIVFVMTLAPSHLLGSMGLARRLTDRGFDVEYWGEQRLKLPCVSQGINYRRVGQVWPSYEPVFERGALGAMLDPRHTLRTLSALRRRRAALPETLLQFKRSIEREVVRRKPQLAIFDPLAIAYHPFFRRLGIRCVALNDKPVPAEDCLVPPPTGKYVPRNTLLSRALVRSLWATGRALDSVRIVKAGCVDAVGMYTTERLVREIQQLAQMSETPARVRRGVSYDLHFEDIEEWVLGAPEIDLPRSRPLPANVCYVGPCVDTRRVERAVELPAKEGRRVVYIAMGISMARWDADVRFLNKTIAALGGLSDVAVFISTGTKKACAALKHSFRNVYVFPHLPQLAVLQSADLVITHGGAYSFRECIASNVPMLVYPRERDQAGNSARVIHHRIGLRGSRRFDTPSTIRKKAMRILEDDRFEKNVRELNEAVKSRETHLLGAALGRPLRESVAWAGE